MDDENELVVVYSTNPIETGFLKGLLEDSGIKVFLIDEFMGSISPSRVSPVGPAGAVKIVVTRTDIEKAKAIIEEFSNKGLQT